MVNLGEMSLVREIMYRNLTSAKNKRRVISVSEKSENKDVITRIHRAFIYIVSREVEAVEDLPAPVFFITKNYHTKTREEKFSFRVKGVFYVIKGNSFLMVHFCHSLRVDIIRKSKVYQSQ